MSSLKSWFEVPEKVFLVLGTCFIMIMVFIMPINRVPDEANHARMAWNIIYEKTTDSFNWMEELSETGSVEKETYKELFERKIDFSKETFKWNFSLKSIMHFPQLLGLMLGKFLYSSIGVMFLLGRIMNALTYIIGMYFIIKKSKFGQFPLIFISLLPIMIQQAASLSYDVINYLAISAFFCLITNIAKRKVLNLKYLLLIFFSALSLYITKRNNILLLVILPFLYLKSEGIVLSFLSLRAISVIKKYRKLLLVILLLFLIVVFSFALKNYGGITHISQVMANTLLNNNLNGHLNTILTVGMFGYIGAFKIQLPLWLIFFDIAILVLLMIQGESEKDNVSKSCGIISASLFPLEVLAIIAGMYIEWTPIVLGENADISVGAQGRYFTPFLIYFVPLFVAYKNEIYITMNLKLRTRLVVITSILNFVILIFLIFTVYWFPANEADWLIKLRGMIN